MAEYIEREALINKLNKFSDECEYNGEFEDCISSYNSDLLDIVEKAPAAEVQVVRHGKWIDWNGEEACCCSDGVFCSECGGSAPISADDYFYRGGKIRYDLAPYCQNCNAIMDKE